MVDFHTHILPNMDDGSESPEMSLKMLTRLSEQGVDTVCLTSHFYAYENDPDTFLKRRRSSARKLIVAAGGLDALPVEVRLGAEVLYYTGMSRDPDQVRKLCLQDTDRLLLEMPFHPWSQNMIDEVLALQGMTGINIMMAHIDRYFGYVPAEVFDTLRNRDIMLTMNVSALTERKTRRKALRLIREWQIGALTSDCHNLTNRPPEIEKAFEILEKHKLQHQIEMFRSISL